jgi:hypothetical protein
VVDAAHADGAELDGAAAGHSRIHRSSMLPAGLTPAQAARWSVPTETDDTDDAFPKNEAMPAELDLSWSDGLDCTTARCLVVTSGPASQLLLVP